VNNREGLFSDTASFGYGLAQAAAIKGSSLPGELLIVPSQMAYMQIPAAGLRNFVDGVFPNLAVNSIADSAKGFGHRYRAGHDLLLDIPQTIGSHGWSEGFKHAGHVILTDFPTKAGIPIPGFSQSGLGHLLEQAGISNGWMQLSLFDTGVGLFVFSESATNLMLAMQGALSMNFGVACQTFGVGTAELALSISTQNPLLMLGGVQNIMAGLVSTWETFSVYVDPLDFLGTGGFSALLGFGLSLGLTNADTSEAVKDAVRSGAVGSLYTVSSAFGFGALAGFITYRLASELALHHEKLAGSRFTVDDNSYQLLVKELSNGNPNIQSFLNDLSLGKILPTTEAALKLKTGLVSAENKIILSDKGARLSTKAPKTKSNQNLLNIKNKTLSSDPSSLESIYRLATKGSR